MSAVFYAELLGVSEYKAERVSRLMDFVHTQDLVIEANPWSAGGLCRVYIKFASQNRFPVFSPAEKFYYDAENNDIFYKTGGLWDVKIKSISDIESYANSLFSGAKTRNNLFAFKDDFYEQSQNW